MYQSKLTCYPVLPEPDKEKKILILENVDSVLYALSNYQTYWKMRK